MGSTIIEETWDTWKSVSWFRKGSPPPLSPPLLWGRQKAEIAGWDKKKITRNNNQIRKLRETATTLITTVYQREGVLSANCSPSNPDKHGATLRQWTKWCPDHLFALCYLDCKPCPPSLPASSGQWCNLLWNNNLETPTWFQAPPPHS